tara:strand:- start:99 stop:761 length:663 start_codon:yes stop_codon:yes gene_type:complete
MPVWFDCETTGVSDDAKITCAVVLTPTKTMVFHSGYGKPMTKTVGLKLVEFLRSCDRVITYNGASFDFKKLHQLTQDDRCKALAKEHFDIMLQFTSESGFYSSMESFAGATFGKGQGKSNTGAWAATAWFTSSSEAEKVIDYCESDCKVLRNLYNHGLVHGCILRKTRSNKINPWVIATSNETPIYKSALDCLQRWQSNRPNTSWMTDPPDLQQTLGWAL